MTTESLIPSTNVNADIDRYVNDGYRLDMILPADAPREALLSRNGGAIRLRSDNGPRGSEEWVTGRAGMMYRDLIADRLSGSVIASHIRLTQDGPVPDYVHYHKIGFQMIYCLQGRIRVVYEDQGPPFWLGPGDCVLQPPEIRHRVLESIGQAEVLEISSPAEHETWVDHELKLPTEHIHPERDFGGQNFVRHISERAEWKPLIGQSVDECDLGIAEATSGESRVEELRVKGPSRIEFSPTDKTTILVYVLDGEAEASTSSQGSRLIARDDCLVVAAGEDLVIDAQAGFRALQVAIGT